MLFVSNWMLLAVSGFGALPTHARQQEISTPTITNTAFAVSYSSYYAPPGSASTTQLLAFKNTVKKRVPRVAVRQRPLVELDELGAYVPHNQKVEVNEATSTSRSNTVAVTDESTTGIDINSDASSWDAFKDGLYNFVDFITRANTRNTIENTITNRKMAIAYSDTVEAQIEKNNRKKPIAIQPPSAASLAAVEQNLLNQYQASLKNTDLSNGENLYQSDLRKSFDSGKDIIYGTIDSLTLNNANVNKSSFFPDTHEKFKVATKLSVNRDEAVAEYASDLASSNPIKRLKANLAIAANERRRKRRLEQERRAETVNSIKQILYDFVDSIQILYDFLVNVPGELEKSLEMTQYEIEKAVVEIQKTPEKIQQIVEGTKKTAKETQKATVNIFNEAQQVPKKVGDAVVGTVKEVQAIPTKVNNSIEETKRSIEETKKGVEYFVQDAKYRTGIEIRPRPPPTPPKAKSPEELGREIALKVAKEAVLFAGKASIVIAQGTADMAVGGVKVALQAAKTAQENSKERKDSDMASERQLVTPIVTSAPPVTPLSIAEIDPSLEKEVSEALRLAEAAVNEPKAVQILKSGAKTNVTSEVSRKTRPVAISPNNIDINDAVKRAKLAAKNAQRDAAELEELLKKR